MINKKNRRMRVSGNLASESRLASLASHTKLAHNRLEKEKIIDLRKIGAIIQKNFIVIIRDKTRILPLIMFPVFMILIFGFTSGNTPKHIPTAIIAYDHSPLSQKIQQEISKSQILALRNVLSTEGEGKKLLDSGRIKVLIEIPPNLQEKIDKGDLVGITVVVDESDSSIASTAKQTINAITNSISKGISIDKIFYFQKSVESASQKLQNYNGQFLNRYSLIVSKVGNAQTYLEDADKKVSQQATSLDNSLSAPTPVIAPEVKQNESNNYFNQTYIPTTPAYLSAKGQIAALKQSSYSIQAAEDELHAASQLAIQGSRNMELSQDYKFQNDNLAKPSKEIKDFTSYSPTNLLRPLEYEEKPAYGTGKRTIDFLIPSIIALVIFQGAVMGMGRAVAGEKKDGSLTRVFLTPTSNVTIILGTLLFYVIFEIFRSSFLIILAMSLFSIKIEGSLIAVFFIVVIYAGVSTAIGMLLSSSVKSEGQYMAMSMLVSMPTIFLGGAFFPIQAMPKFLQGVAAFLPVTYAGSALRGIMIKGFSLITISYEIFILLVFLILTVGAVFLVFKRDIE